MKPDELLEIWWNSKSVLDFEEWNKRYISCINCNNPVTITKRQLSQEKWECPKCKFWNRKEALPICPRCGSNNIGKHSTRITKRNWITRRYACKSCRRTFNFNGVMRTNKKCFIVHRPEIIEEALSLTKNLSDPKVAKYLNKKYGLNICISSILHWRWKFLLKKGISRYPAHRIWELKHGYISKERKEFLRKELLLSFRFMEADLYRCDLW